METVDALWQLVCKLVMAFGVFYIIGWIISVATANLLIDHPNQLD